jgi:predicted Zn-dependent protease
MSRIGEFERFRPLFAQSARSFRPLADADRRRIVVARLRAQAAREGETLSALVRRAGGAWNPEQTAIANGVDVDSRLQPGWLVKVPIRQAYTARRA